MNPYATLLRLRGTRPARGPEHRCIVVVDIAGFGQWDNETQLRARQALITAVDTALRTGDISLPKLAIEDRGDGMIMLIPPSVSKVDILDPVLPTLAREIRAHNSIATPRLRLRVAVHAGEVHRDARGWVGADLNTTCRLVNGEPLYQRMYRTADLDLILVVSDLIYHSVVRHHYRRIDPADYTAVHITIKETSTTAWLHTTGTTCPGYQGRQEQRYNCPKWTETSRWLARLRLRPRRRRRS